MSEDPRHVLVMAHRTAATGRHADQVSERDKEDAGSRCWSRGRTGTLTPTRPR